MIKNNRLKLIKKIAIIWLTFSAVFFLSGFNLFVNTAKADTENKFIVQLKSDNASILNNQSITVLKKLFDGSSQNTLQNTYLISSEQSIENLKNYFGNEANYVQRNYVMNTAVDLQLNDPGFTPNSNNIDKQWGLAKAGFVNAWKKTASATGAKIAVIDTGIDQQHEDLKGVSFVLGFNFLANSAIFGGANSDDNGHGTLVTGVIAATQNNQLGIAGAVQGVTIIPIKALDDKGTGTSADISEAIIWATDQGANIINMSLGGIGFSHDITLSNAISYAFSKNVLVIAAAGNDVAANGGNLDQEPVFPICADNGQNMVLGVTATDVNDLKPDFANFGKACVDVSAPGKRILSTINHDPVTKTYFPNGYAYASGTSLAVPFVSAQAALLKTLFPQASNKQLRDYIIASAENIDDKNYDTCSMASCKDLIGSGRINVARSIDEGTNRYNLSDGDIVQERETANFYLINGGKKQLISKFVKTQRFSDVLIKNVSGRDLERFNDGPYAEPVDGTLVKDESSLTVYYMYKGLKMPITYQVFKQRNLNFADVVILSDVEVSSWLQGSFLAPAEGSLVKANNAPTVYWVINGVLHPMNKKYYLNKGLNIFPIEVYPAQDLKNFSKGEAYIDN